MAIALDNFVPDVLRPYIFRQLKLITVKPDGWSDWNTLLALHKHTEELARAFVRVIVEGKRNRI
jgi:hypothetical protein